MKMIDVYIDKINRFLLETLTIIVLGKSRSMGYRASSELFCEAFRSYDPDFPVEALGVIAAANMASHIRKKWNVKHKEDFLFLLRHPELVGVSKVLYKRPRRKIVLRFYDLELPGNEYKVEAYNYLKEMRPVARGTAINKVLSQYLILTGNEIYTEQAIVRISEGFLASAEYNAHGELVGRYKEIVDTLWDCIDENKDVLEY